MPVDERPIPLETLQVPGTALLCAEALPPARTLHALFFELLACSEEEAYVFVDGKKPTPKRLDGAWKRLELHDPIGTGLSVFVSAVNPRAKPVYFRVQFRASMDGYDVTGLEVPARAFVAGLPGSVFFEYEAG